MGGDIRALIIAVALSLLIRPTRTSESFFGGLLACPLALVLYAVAYRLLAGLAAAV
jgi:hypothetical protein